LASVLNLPETHLLPGLPPGRLLRDSYGRAITDLRVSITGRCNYRCVYCRTGNGAVDPELPVAEYLRLIRVFVSLGIEKVRLTGGEPLLRQGLVEMVQELSRLRIPFNEDGYPLQEEEQGRRLDLALTTNGHLLEGLAQPLKDAGLSRVTVSMDAVDPDRFAAITRVPGSFHRVLAGIRKARQVGLDPLKVNCVLVRGLNEDQIVPFAHFAREEGVIVRFIEVMPLDEDRTWSIDAVVSLKEVVAKLAEVAPLRALPPTQSGETARRYTFEDSRGEIGIIAPVTQSFCGQCSRIRLTSDGKIRTCLFSTFEHDLHGLMQGGASDDELAIFIVEAVHLKEARHHIGEAEFIHPARSMVQIGG
jgi:cyclic pyranopterin phosphate synthase